MSFLAPLFLLGAAAVALPIVFHLMRRTTRERTVFSSLMFLAPTPPRVTRKSRIENLWLLLLRCLVIALLALGFARPFFKKPVVAASGSANQRLVVLLIDTSASMQRDGFWPEAIRQAEIALRGVSSADSLAIYGFDAQLQPVLRFDEWSALPLDQRVPQAAGLLKQMKPGWLGTHLGNAMARAVEMAEQEQRSGEDLDRSTRMIVISDFQEGSKLDGLQGYEWPSNLEVSLVSIPGPPGSNAGLHAARTGTGAGAEGLRVRVSNASNSKREQFRVGWEGRGEWVDIYVPSGQSRIVPVPDIPSQAPAGQLRLIGDEADFDNTLHIVAREQKEVSVAFFGSDRPEDPQGLAFYLHRAFAESREPVVQISEGAGAALSVVSDRATEEQERRLRSELEQGGTVLFVLKSAAGTEGLGRLAGVPGMRATEQGGDRYRLLGQIDFQHPLFGPFADPRFSDFSKIHFWRHRSLDVEGIPDARVLARFDNAARDPAIVELPVGLGRIVVFTFAWNPSESQFGLSSKFVPFLYALLEQSGSLQARAVQLQTGDPIPWPSDLEGSGIPIQLPDGSTADWPAGQALIATGLPGIYTARAGATELRWAVNLPPEESRTAPMDLRELEQLGLPLALPETAAAAAAAPTATGAQQLRAVELESQQKLWRWLIVAALGVLMAESLLAGYLARRSQRTVEVPV